MFSFQKWFVGHSHTAVEISPVKINDVIRVAGSPNTLRNMWDFSFSPLFLNLITTAHGGTSVVSSEILK